MTPRQRNYITGDVLAEFVQVGIGNEFISEPMVQAGHISPINAHKHTVPANHFDAGILDSCEGTNGTPIFNSKFNIGFAEFALMKTGGHVEEGAVEPIIPQALIVV